jgi:5-methylthioadenosine/S-adenosylhomocysteine deaminase
MVCMVREPGDVLSCDAALDFTNDRDEHIVQYEVTEGNLIPAGSDTFVVSKNTARKNVITAHIYDVNADGTQGMEMATANAGVALGLNIGKIEKGALADILIVDTDNYNFLSPGSFEANLIYSAHSDCIDSVICNGEFIMRNRVVPGEKEILAQAKKVLSKL